MSVQVGAIIIHLSVQITNNQIFCSSRSQPNLFQIFICVMFSSIQKKMEKCCHVQTGCFLSKYIFSTPASAKYPNTWMFFRELDDLLTRSVSRGQIIFLDWREWVTTVIRFYVQTPKYDWAEYQIQPPFLKCHTVIISRPKLQFSCESPKNN